MRMVEEQRQQPAANAATSGETKRPRRPSKRAIGVSEWQWRLMLLALALLALVMLTAIVLFVLAAFGGLRFA
ncbi:MAG: hypothetical protein DLM69_08260 [Candidatus Chloroheliales bacterium]|nr:MAG: hypothetical protein DLM69_08260 [Chloroflexota bacterium]